MTYAKKTLSEIKLIHGDYGNFIKGQKLDKKKEKKYKMPPYKDLAASNEIDGEPLDEKCWPGYEKKGMKTMFGKRYPNCVKKKKTRKEEYSDWRSELEEKKEPELPKFTQKSINKAGGSSKSFVKKTPKSIKGSAKVLSKLGGIGGSKGRIVASGLLGAALAGPTIVSAIKGIIKRRKNAAIDKQVDKYVADRKGTIRKVNYMPDNMYTVKRDKDGKVTGTGDKIRVVPGTRTTSKSSQPDSTKKSRFSQHTRMKLGNYGSLSPMDEKMDLKKASMGDVITDFRKSDAPQFKGKSDKKIQKMAIAAKLEADGKSLKDEYLPEILDKKDVPHVKKLVKKLRDGSKTHAKQADDLEKAVNEGHYGSDVNKIPAELDKAVALHKSQAERLRKSPEFKKDAGKTANKIPGQLDKAVAMHTKQAKELRAAGIGEKNCGCGKTPCKTYGKKSVKEDITDDALTIQNWNVDDIKFTEIETVDIIKPKPLKESMSNWRAELDEDWQKVNRKDKTDGLSRKAVKAYRRENPGSKLQTAVTKDPKKLKKGSKSAKRRLSFCRRMKGMKKKLTSAKTRRDPDSRINKALRRWNC